MSHAAQARPATYADLEQIVAIERHTPDAAHWPASSYAAAFMPSAPDAPQRCLMVAEFEAGTSPQLAGFAVGCLLPASAPEGAVVELESVAVRMEARRLGLGRALCEAIVCWARSRGACTVDLEVRARSEGAITLYTQLGFLPVGRRPRYYRDPEDDAILMRLGIG